MGKLKVTILSLSVVTVMASAAVGPALGVIGKYFSGTDPLLIKFIITLPSLCIILTSFVFDAVAKRLSSRGIAVAGMVLYIAGGLGAAFADSIYVLLGFRLVLGIGVGLIMPLSTGLLGYYFDRSEQAKLMGYSVAMNNLGGVIATVLSGILAAIQWQYAFATYLLGFVVLALVMLFLPKAELSRKGNALGKDTLRVIAPYAGAMFLTMIAFYIVPSSFAMIASAAGLASTSTIGWIMAVQNLVAFAAGMLLSRILKIAGKAAQFLTSGAMALGFLGLSFTGSLPLTILGLIAIGFSMGTVVPILNAQIALRVDKEKITSAMAVMSAMLYLGQFLSPILIDGVQAMLHLQGIQTPYIIAAALAVLLCVSFLIIPVSTAKNE